MVVALWPEEKLIFAKLTGLEKAGIRMLEKMRQVCATAS
jgi:hypothetical protein